MKLIAAIKRLNELVNYLGVLETRGDISALKLGIKAMEFGKGYFGATNFLYLIEHQDETK